MINSPITWILLPIIIGLLCQVRPTNAAVKCYDCKPKKIEDECYSEDKVENEKDCASSDGCVTYRFSEVGDAILLLGSRSCLPQKFVECLRSHTGLDMEDGRCLKTTLPFEKLAELNKCVNDGEKGEQVVIDDKARQGGSQQLILDLRVCTCKGDLCNKAAIWKPDEFTEEAIEGGEGGGGGAALRRHAAWSCVTIAIVLFTLSPFQ